MASAKSQGPERRAVERSFAWRAKFRRLARDDERAPYSGVQNG